MFTVEVRIAVVGRVRGQTYRQVREAFQRRFRKPAPNETEYPNAGEQIYAHRALSR